MSKFEMSVPGNYFIEHFGNFIILHYLFLQAEEVNPVDQENQGNTLASDAPLNPPQETQEKPSVNGESLEAVKTETSPPTNGHSTAKTADTELWNRSKSAAVQELPPANIFIHTDAYLPTQKFGISSCSTTDATAEKSVNRDF